MTSNLVRPGAQDTPLLVDVLRVAGEQRQRVATKAATELLAEVGKDQRAGALRIAKLLAEAGRLIEVADQLEAGLMVLLAVDPDDVGELVGVALTDAVAGEEVDVLIQPGPTSTEDALRRAVAERRLTVVPPPTEETPPVTPPASPTDEQADQAAAEAEAILDEAFPGDDPELGTVLPEEGKLPPMHVPAVSVAPGAAGRLPYEPPTVTEVAAGMGPTSPAVAAELEEALAADDYQLPPGQGDDDDLGILDDVADLPGFDADLDLGDDEVQP